MRASGVRYIGDSMFTWICPKCGGEVPPSETDCPRCAAAQNAAPAVEKAAPPAPPRRRGVPAWAITLLVAAGLIAGGGALIWRVKRSQASAKPEFKTSQPAAPGVARNPHPLAKYVEVTGLRVSEDAKRNVNVKMLVVNHSLAEIPAMELKVELRPATATEEGPPLCSFSAKIPSLTGHSSAEVSTTAKTNLRAYELPDWQFLKADYEIVSPKP